MFAEVLSTSPSSGFPSRVHVPPPGTVYLSLHYRSCSLSPWGSSGRRFCLERLKSRWLPGAGDCGACSGMEVGGGRWEMLHGNVLRLCCPLLGAVAGPCGLLASSSLASSENSPIPASSWSLHGAEVILRPSARDALPRGPLESTVFMQACVCRSRASNCSRSAPLPPEVGAAPRADSCLPRASPLTEACTPPMSCVIC